MTAYLHLNPGDTLWIDGWVPGRSSTLWGACVALILLGIGHRWLAAARAGVERAIRDETCVCPVCNLCDLSRRPRRFASVMSRDKDKGRELSLLEMTIFLRGAAPFVLDHAWARGVLQMIHASLSFLFMLAVMCAPHSPPFIFLIDMFFLVSFMCAGHIKLDSYFR